MGLYLVIFDEEKEIEGVEIGTYSDFGFFRDAVARELEKGMPGSLFPTLMRHSDCRGVWTPADSLKLENELEMIAEAFRKMPPVPFNSVWQSEVAQSFGLNPKNLYESFIDVDGEPLLGRMKDLAHLSHLQGLPILFQ